MTIYRFATWWLSIIGVVEFKMLLVSLEANLLLRSSLSRSPFIGARIWGCRANRTALRPYQRPFLSCTGLHQIARLRFLGSREYNYSSRDKAFSLEGFLRLSSNMCIIQGQGMELPASYPLCGLDDESTENALLCCPRIRLIWRMVGCHL